MNVTLCSAFRNASSFIGRYFEQMAKLQERLDEREDELHLVLCEGDSMDNTWSCLYSFTDDFNCEVFRLDHGGPAYGSVVNAERFANIAKVCNAIWERIPQACPVGDADAVIFVESDLIWQPATMLALLDDLEHVPAVSPMVMLEREGWPPNLFYDTWAFRRNGAHFTHNPPYVPLTIKGHTMMMDTGLEQIDSAGSCMAIRGPLARQLCWPAEDVFVGLCRRIYEMGGSVWLDPMQRVVHL